MSKKIVTVPFSGYILVTTASGVGSSPITPAGVGAALSRFSAMCDQYGLYRLKSMKFRVVKDQNTTLVAGVLSNFQDTSLSTINLLLEAQATQIAGSLENYRAPYMNVPREILAGALPWYKTIAGTPDSWEETPATIYVINGAGTTGGVIVELRFVVEFKDPVAPASTPEVRANRQALCQDRERKRVLALVSGTLPIMTSGALPLFGKPPSAPARTQNEQTRPLEDGDSDLRGNLASACLTARAVGK